MISPFVPCLRTPRPVYSLQLLEHTAFNGHAPEGCHKLTSLCISLSVDNTGTRTLHSRAETTPSPANNAGNGHPEYIAYVLVPVFFIMGLLGVLICHLLKKKGYRCTTEAEQDIEEEKVEKIGK